MRRDLLQEVLRREASLPKATVIAPTPLGYFCEVGQHTEHHKCHMPGCQCICHDDDGYGMYMGMGG